MRAIGYLLYLILIAFHEVILRGGTSIAGVSINLPAIIVFSVALYRSEAEAVWFALIAAMVISLLIGEVVDAALELLQETLNLKR